MKRIKPPLTCKTCSVLCFGEVGKIYECECVVGIISLSPLTTMSISRECYAKRIAHQKNASNTRKKYAHPILSSVQTVVVTLSSGLVVLTQSCNLSYTPTSAVIQSREYAKENATIDMATKNTPAFVFTAVKPVAKLAAANGMRLQTMHA